VWGDIRQQALVHGFSTLGTGEESRLLAGAVAARKKTRGAGGKSKERGRVGNGDESLFLVGTPGLKSSSFPGREVNPFHALMSQGGLFLNAFATAWAVEGPTIRYSGWRREYGRLVAAN